jgi:hypothetical protein
VDDHEDAVGNVVDNHEHAASTETPRRNAYRFEKTTMENIVRAAKSISFLQPLAVEGIIPTQERLKELKSEEERKKGKTGTITTYFKTGGPIQQQQQPNEQSANQQHVAQEERQQQREDEQVAVEATNSNKRVKMSRLLTCESCF